jgi:hypothetical protein
LVQSKTCGASSSDVSITLSVLPEGKIMRLTTHARQSKVIQDAVQQKVQRATQVELTWLWREIRLRLTNLKAQKPVIKADADYTVYQGDLWEEFRRRLHQKIMAIVYSAGMDLIEHEIELAILRDWRPPFDFSHERIIEEYTGSLGTRINQVTLNTQKMVAERIAKWYKTPGETIGKVVNDLRPEFGITRAELIAQTEITSMNSHIQEKLAVTLGYNTWWNETRRDQLVCQKKMVGPDNTIVDGCRALHGKVFVFGKSKLPPHHPGCRCSAHIIHGEPYAGYIGQLTLGKWEEAEHPRSENGEFGNKGSSLPYKEWKNNLPEQVSKHLKGNSDEVTNKTFATRFAVNRELRTGKKEDNPYNLEIDDTIEALTLATTKHAHVLESPMIVYRGVDSKFAKKLSKKTMLTDKGFAYTTTDAGIAHKYSAKKGVVIRIELPAGTKCALGFEDQHELILPRNTSFEISKDENGNLQGRIK